MSYGCESYPVGAELALSEQRIAQLAGLLSTPGLPPGSRNNRERYTDWSERYFLEYGKWVHSLLPPDTGLTGRHLRAASKLGLGPSLYAIGERAIGVPDIISYYSDKPRTNRIEVATRHEMVMIGKSTSDALDQRLSKPLIMSLHAAGEFFSLEVIKQRFGSLSNFQEETGRPHPYQWKAADYLEWGVAFLRQNNKSRITKADLEEMSKRGVGPGAYSVRKAFHTIETFNELLSTVKQLIDQLEQQRRQANIEIAQELISNNPTLMHRRITEDEMLRQAALLRIAKTLHVPLSVSLLESIAHGSSDKAAHLLANNSKASIARVEILAIELKVFDDIWPMPRFHNVDLRLKQKS